MIVYLPMRLYATGGSSVFARALAERLPLLGHQIVFSLPADYDVLLASGRAPIRALLNARRRRRPIIQRLDGAYYPTTIAGWAYPLYNAPLKVARALASVTVYQSAYARAVTGRFIGHAHGPSTIIYNGVDTALFSPEGKRAPTRDRPSQRCLFTTQQIRRRDQIEPLLAALAIYRRRYHADTQLVVAGDWLPSVASLKRRLAKRPDVKLLGPVAHEMLPSYLRSADVFVYCHPNPACPNNVLEAMAAGLPIIGLNDGAMPELIREGRDGLLVPVEGTGYFRRRPFPDSAFAAALDRAYHQRATLGSTARQRAIEHFSLSRMLDAYAATITGAVTRQSAARSGV